MKIIKKVTPEMLIYLWDNTLSISDLLGSSKKFKIKEKYCNRYGYHALNILFTDLIIKMSDEDIKEVFIELLKYPRKYEDNP